MSDRLVHCDACGESTRKRVCDVCLTRLDKGARFWGRRRRLRVWGTYGERLHGRDVCSQACAAKMASALGLPEGPSDA